MSTFHRFTEEEDLVILSHVRGGQNSLQNSFKKAAEELNLTKGQVQNRYYRHLRFKSVTPCFLTKTEKEEFLNREVDEVPNYVEPEKKAWYYMFTKWFK